MNTISSCIFDEDWWLDAVSGEKRWSQVSIFDPKTNYQATIKFLQKQRYGKSTIQMPPFTPYLGPVYSHEFRTTDMSVNEENRLNELLIEKLPTHEALDMSFHWRIQNWLAWYWNGYQQTTFYTYRIPIGNSQSDFQNLRNNTKRVIRYAKFRHSLEFTDAVSINELLDVAHDTGIRKRVSLVTDESVIERLYQILAQRKRGKILGIRDPQGELQAAMLIVWDELEAYYLLGGIKGKSKDLGAGSLLIWEAIRYSHNMGRVFNFEGSMNKTINHFFSGFNPLLTPYFRIHKASRRHRIFLKLETLL